jgi:hypothetical protein
MGVTYRTGLTNSTKGVTAVSSTPDLQGQINNLKSQLVAARVIDIVLDENHPKFKDVGGWNGIGAIYYEFTNQSATGTTINFALPYDSQIKTYPLVNEIVLLFSLPNQQQGQNTSNQSYFYLKPLGIWNHPHHDAYPNSSTVINRNQRRDYKATENGTVRRVKDESTEIDLNSPVNPSQNTFVEKTDIHPLMPYMGDSLLEGRHGQSLRFGSTAKSKSSINNNWSSTGDNGDPITIIRNGQPAKVSDRGWIPIVENINDDLSSIYLTSYQKIPFNISYTSKSTLPSQFTNPQIILNSDRIVLNAKTDSVLISGEKSVEIFSNSNVNIESTSEIDITSKLVKLGSTNANQAVLLGDNTIFYLKALILEVENLAIALKSVQNWPGGVPTPNPTLLEVTTCTLINLEEIYNKIDSVKSKTVKTV